LLHRSEQGLNIPFFVDSDSASESSNASSTIERKTKAVAKPKIKDVEVPDTMKDMQATFSGIFGEKNKI